MDTIKRLTGRMLSAISDTLEHPGTPLQQLLCAVMLALLSFAALPGGYYACQTAMFAVLLRLGLGVPAAFAGVCAGFAVHFASGNLIACWQLPAAAMLWLLCGAWSNRTRRLPMLVAVFLSLLSVCAVADVRAPLQAAAVLLTAVSGAGLSLLYDGAALCVSRREELDGDTRPLCIMAVAASLVAALTHLPFGGALAMAFAAYLTAEHAFSGGGTQAVLCGGVTGCTLSLCVLRAEPCAMLLCGGFLAGEIRTGHRSLSALLMLLGMAGAGAAVGGGADLPQMLLTAVAGLLPFLMLSARMRLPVTGLIEQPGDAQLSQSEAVAVRSAAMIHAWARLYDETARMMQGLMADDAQTARRCVDLLHRTSAAAHQVCERTLSRIRPDDEAFRAIRYALVHAGQEEVRPAYALQIGGREEVLLLKPEAVAPVALAPLVSRACGVAMRPCVREGMLSTQALFEQTPPLTLEIGAALLSRSGEEVAGDGYISRALPGGQHILAISDGMGCGAEAMQQSHAALSLLAESLKAGYTREQALGVVNALMLMCTGREMYATMDLCVIDLHSGEAAFEKLGACASYVVRSGEVRTVGADTLPVGVLPEVEATSLRLTLEAGDMIVMMSDGVELSYPGGADALREAIGGLTWLHPQAVGQKLIAKATESGGARDDMAVLCARVGRTLAE